MAVMQIAGPAYLVTVKAKDGVLSDVDDIMFKPQGNYLVLAPDQDRALDEFHARIPIGCLDDFDIDCREISK